ncbi:PhzF family phenazine biosynthesis protein [Paracoccus marcusii]|uniref:PhzF family phenazine biosynthesis protein n=1 Tax=Paracoccus marcusii TaxID=59779 RepID=UPI002ED601B8|nr:PhzF family phenazine biosynthesis protein [Paracoccus marcusii]
MQTIARQFNLSETIFVMAPRDPAHRARVRIFLPLTEIPSRVTLPSAARCTCRRATAIWCWRRRPGRSP